ncbi:alpha/beta fold hydrolase [Streptomyces sp. NPDC008092]|uniref:alpha/beta fold hydrolase n=1 Tax=Streptomyces sp. NPDC008092 TaxID=3364808 RepID=UPI0036EF89E1
MSTNHIDVVLVHGAWADGSSWSKVIGPLKADGVRVVAAPLPLTSLTDDVTALDRVLDRLGGTVVLVGHAYAGTVITATRHPKVASLVYVAALAPDEGESAGDVFHRGRPHPLTPKLAPDAHGMVWLSDRDFTDAFAQHASAEEQAILAAAQRPIGAPSIGAPIERPLWKDRPSWFLVAEDDRMIAPETQRFTAERMGAHVRTRPVDHTPQVTAPQDVVDIVLDAVRDVVTTAHPARTS